MAEQSAQLTGGGSNPALPLQSRNPYVDEQQVVRRREVAVRLMDSKEANAICEKNHYLHRKRVGKLVAYGVYWCDEFYGVLLFAKPMVSHPMFGFQPSEIIELARVWFKENPKNLGSSSIRFALRRIQQDWPGTKAVVSWCDTSRFEGTLYKVTGFQFMGMSRVRSLDKSAVRWGGGRPGRKVQPDRLAPKQKWLIVLPETKPVVRVSTKRFSHSTV